MSNNALCFPKVSDKFKLALRLAIPALLLFAVLGCSKSAYYQTYVPSAADVSGIERVAVADFDGLERSGRIVALKLSEGIVDAGHFRLFERAELDRILAERDFNQSGVVDPTTVTVANAPVKIKGKGTAQASIEDVDGDGLDDLVVHVLTEALELTEGDVEAPLTGETFGGTNITGSDSVRIVP